MLSTREVLGKDDEPSASGTAAQPISDTASELPANPVTDAAHKLIGKRVRVRVRGGRQLSGDFHCFDKQGNIILSNAYEQREPRERAQIRGAAPYAAPFAVIDIQAAVLRGEPPNDHSMGMVLVPTEQRLTCEVLALPFDREGLEALLSTGMRAEQQ